LCSVSALVGFVVAFNLRRAARKREQVRVGRAARRRRNRRRDPSCFNRSTVAVRIVVMARRARPATVVGLFLRKLAI
jgi:hypothetical protein